MSDSKVKKLPRMVYIDQAQEQMREAGMTPKDEGTIILWIKKYALGHKVGGQWVLVEERFHKFLLGLNWRTGERIEENGDG